MFAGTDCVLFSVLNAILLEAQSSFYIHYETTIPAVCLMISCYNNLVLFVPLRLGSGAEWT